MEELQIWSINVEGAPGLSRLVERLKDSQPGVVMVQETRCAQSVIQAVARQVFNSEQATISTTVRASHSFRAEIPRTLGHDGETRRETKTSSCGEDGGWGTAGGGSRRLVLVELFAGPLAAQGGARTDNHEDSSGTQGWSDTEEFVGRRHQRGPNDMVTHKLAQFGIEVVDDEKLAASTRFSSNKGLNFFGNCQQEYGKSRQTHDHRGQVEKRKDRQATEEHAGARTVMV